MWPPVPPATTRTRKERAGRAKDAASAPPLRCVLISPALCPPPSLRFASWVEGKAGRRLKTALLGGAEAPPFRTAPRDSRNLPVSSCMLGNVQQNADRH